MNYYDTFVFDLDGTLLDTSPGIIASVKCTEAALSLRTISLAEQRSIIGPPLEDSFARLYGVTGEGLTQVMDTFDEYYDSPNGAGSVEPYPGIVDLVNFLRSRDCKLSVATMKEQRYTDYALAAHDLTPYFDSIACYDEAGAPSKSDLILRTLKEMGCTDLTRVLMIGDSAFDGIGAQQSGIDFVAITSGFGFVDPQELDRIPYVLKTDRIDHLRAFIEERLV